jgi:orotate phosphoribosyltransferase
MENVLTLLRESGAMLEGHFLLSSGRHSNRYFQCAKLLQYPDRAAAAFAGIAEKIKKDIQSGKLEIDAVVGPAMGGIVAAYELGRQLGLPAFFTERALSQRAPSNEGGAEKMTLRRGFEVRPGMKILITEDVVTTGKSSGECAAVLEELGAQITALACLVDRRQAGIEVPWPLYSACAVEALNWEADMCELCKKGIPVVKPGSRMRV